VKIYSIRNEYIKGDNLVGYLCYYQSDRTFGLELKEGLGPVEMTMFLEAFAGKNIYSVDPYWSGRWVQERIVPTDRQNLGAILRDAGLKEYDPHRLLVLASGRCAQDDLFISPVREDELEPWARERFSKRLSAAIPLSNGRMMMTIKDKSTYLVQLKPLMENDAGLKRILSDELQFQSLKLITGGTGITFGEGLYLMKDALMTQATPGLVDANDWKKIVIETVMDTAKICETYGVSRQYVNRLVSEGTLSSLPLSGRSQVFLRPDVERIWRN